jgi:hypothetical protein
MKFVYIIFRTLVPTLYKINYVAITKTSCLMLPREMIVVYSEDHVKPTKTLSVCKLQGFLMLKQMIYTVPTVGMSCVCKEYHVLCCCIDIYYSHTLYTGKLVELKLLDNNMILPLVIITHTLYITTI